MLVVGMFDDADSLEQGLERLSEGGLDEAVQRFETTPGATTPGAAGASEGGAIPVDMGRGSGTSSPGPGTAHAAERQRIGGNVLDAEEREYYQRLLREGGRIITVEVEDAQADEAERLLHAAGASRVARHVR